MTFTSEILMYLQKLEVLFKSIIIIGHYKNQC